MDKRTIKEFFDNLAPSWDENQKRNEEAISLILDKGGIKQGVSVLDVASGTGVLFGDYLRRGASVTGIDISDKMLSVASQSFPQVELLCGDAETYSFEKQFDAVMIYNAFPHFPNPVELFRNLSSALREGGRLTVAHGLSERELRECHSGQASKVSLPLPSKQELAELMSAFCKVDVMISDEIMYMVSGVKLPESSEEKSE